MQDVAIEIRAFAELPHWHNKNPFGSRRYLIGSILLWLRPEQCGEKPADCRWMNAKDSDPRISVEGRKGRQILIVPLP
jgi:hypothetical protein